MAKQNTILIADDAELNRAILRNMFEEEYNLLEAENGEQALMLLRQYSDRITMVLLDLVMPGKDGYEVMEEMRKEDLLLHIPVIVITADDSKDSKVRVFELGASDIIGKPFEPDVVKSRVKNIIELSRYRRHLEELVEIKSQRERDSNSAVIDLLSSVVEHRSLESGQHIRRIRLFTKILLEDVAENYREYGLTQRRVRLITDAASMHDIGKIAIPDSILNKPGKLTDEEFEVMKTHTVKGCEILTGLDQLQDKDYLEYAYHICRYHHERWDGRGYPDGLKGDSIPISAQVVSIADCYDALTTDRVYKKAISHQQAFNMILNGECGIFSPRLLECFKHVQEQFEQLAKEYADGLSTNIDLAKQLASKAPVKPLGELADSTFEQCQMKYFALLRYADATAMELDLNSGVYHLVYLADQDFAALGTGDSFEGAIRAFASASVHPDDREKFLGLLNGYIQALFDEGLLRRTQRYRVFCRETGKYVWCETALIRSNTENPYQRKVMLFWRKANKEQPEQGPAIPCAESIRLNFVTGQLLGGIQKCRNDKYFTLIQVNPGLRDMLGYSAQEIEEQFHNHFIELVLPADREKLGAQFQHQLEAGKSMELEYRLTAKDGHIVWVSDRCLLAEENGEEFLYSILLDVTYSRQTEEQLRLSLERNQIIMEQTNDIIFEWDIQQDELHFSSSWEKQYGYSPITKRVRSEIPRASHIDPDDMPAFIGLMDAIAAGVPYKEIEFRITDAEGEYRWRRVRATALFDENGQPFKAVGVMQDIDAQKRASAELEAKAERDSLTGLYNKATGREKVNRYLGACGANMLSVLMILDLDDFKQINDRFGHMFGDAVLVELSAKIAELFHDQEIVARIGGDEFLLFIPDIRTEKAAQRCAAQVLEIFQDTLRENLGDTLLSCSIGAALAHGRDESFETLFEYADRALYRAKAAGKNRFLFYQEKMLSGEVGLPVERGTESYTLIDSDDSTQWSLPRLIVGAFDILYGAEDFDGAVQAILKMVGELFGVSRTYIFETTPDGEHGNNTFEWCAKGITPQMELLQGLQYNQAGGDYRDNFGSDGIFYCPNVKKLPRWQRMLLDSQGILAMLQCAIRDGKRFMGFIGFDDCAIRRLWTREQIEALTFVGKLLSVFLQRRRAQDALRVSVENLYSVLDHQEAWLYVLDPETYALRYVNKKTRELVPEAEPGKVCYEAFYHRSSPCRNCVMARAQKSGGEAALEIYNPILDLWVLADAAIVNWDRKRACLISCRDISKYKKAPAQTNSGGRQGKDERH